jgi:DNA-binding transcriptional LysR family regulator
VVRAGLGVSIIPREAAASHAQALGLQVVPLSDAWAKRRFAICYRDRAALPRAAALLLDHLVEVGRRAG